MLLRCVVCFVSGRVEPDNVAATMQGVCRRSFFVCRRALRRSVARTRDAWFVRDSTGSAPARIRCHGAFVFYWKIDAPCGRAPAWPKRPVHRTVVTVRKNKKSKQSRQRSSSRSPDPLVLPRCGAWKRAAARYRCGLRGSFLVVYTASCEMRIRRALPSVRVMKGMSDPRWLVAGRWDQVLSGSNSRPDGPARGSCERARP